MLRLRPTSSLVARSANRTFVPAVKNGQRLVGYNFNRNYRRGYQTYTQQARTWNWGRALPYAALATTALGVVYVLSEDELEADAKVDYDKVRKEIAAIVQEDMDRGPTLVRLAWHASGTFSKADHSGGSDGGFIRHNPESGYGANAGLDKARQWLEKVKKSNPGISYADLFTLAGVVAIEEMGGPKIKWRPGRSDSSDQKGGTPDGRLPDASKGSDHIRDIFYRMGFDDREIVALLGAHSLGRCHPDRSGYDGPWTKAPTTFSNMFYTELLENEWTPRKWNGPMQYKDKEGALMMLPADLALIKDPQFRKYVEMYAKDSDLFFKDFGKAFEKLLELGVKKFESKGWWSWITGK